MGVNFKKISIKIKKNYLCFCKLLLRKEKEIDFLSFFFRQKLKMKNGFTLNRDLEI